MMCAAVRAPLTGAADGRCPLLLQCLRTVLVAASHAPVLTHAQVAPWGRAQTYSTARTCVIRSSSCGHTATVVPRS